MLIDYSQNRKEQVVLTRRHIGHGRLTHSYLLTLTRCRIGHGRLTHSYLLSNEE
jgi:hypothetical protein